MKKQKEPSHFLEQQEQHLFFSEKRNSGTYQSGNIEGSGYTSAAI